MMMMMMMMMVMVIPLWHCCYCCCCCCCCCCCYAFQAEGMKKEYIGKEDYSSIQSEEGIKELLSQAMQRWGMRLYSCP
ncbi:hypothetical protein COO60DRAFT_808178 [Scenedesmus sp. NREL 46B-D3]|nr:hypothetical protein COO60DRAFT_808178 [Scenedesmus sp. NREL 46B-D3]